MSELNGCDWSWAMPKTLPTTRKRWAALIQKDLAEAAKAIVKTGIHLIKAKEVLPHGEWEPFLRNDLRIQPRTAERFMAIARHPVLASQERSRQLPAAWGTLYELSRMEAPALINAIEAGEVHPDMERKDAANILRLYHEGYTEPQERHGRPRADIQATPGVLAVLRTLTSMQAAAHARRYAGSEDFRNLIDEAACWIAEVRETLDEQGGA